ncbi:hypothetical protein ASG43_07560 [Aureimonas sp. Leaf454]|uniref:ComEC/Rec2 family competence protein n=1 Tax=Aureimonas sp. Leaf454 TaxID=1736381 RepID=UPI0006F6D09B|nr:ComEC/Rec2 family competence protein [Aureimonas sp. Leaf454]KQT48713.1 hypothetical protein ASG43_07560 [Aureimonas sp. Leaf454]
MDATDPATKPHPWWRWAADGAARLPRVVLRSRSGRWPTTREWRSWFAREFTRNVEREARARSGFFLVPLGLMIGIILVHTIGLRVIEVPATGVRPPDLRLTAVLSAAGRASVPPMVLAAAIAAVASIPALLLAWTWAGRGLKGAAALLFAFTVIGTALATAELGWTTTTIISGDATTRIQGRVLWRDRDDSGRMRYVVRIGSTDRPVLTRPPETASILVSSRHETIPVGGRFAGLVRLRAPSGPAMPGAYDFAFASFFEGRGANGFALGAPEPSTEIPRSLTVSEKLVRLRLSVSDRIRDVIGGGAGAVAAALMTGERSGIPDDIDDALRATGLSHVLSISGLHMALVAGFAMMLVRGLLASFPRAALHLPIKKIAAAAALVVATAYLVLSGSNVATDRSFVMLSIMLVAILVDRSALTLRNVGLAAVLVLLTSPHAVLTASFQMSFAATTALVGIYGLMSRRRDDDQEPSRRPGRIRAVLLFFGGLAASSAIAGLATAPFAAYHFQRMAPYGVVANLVALPVFSFWIMPLALISAILMPFGLDAVFLVLMGKGLDFVFLVATTLASHLPDSPSGRLTSSGLVVISGSLLVGCLCASRLRWLSLPLALVGLLLLPDRGRTPELLVFEDGKEVAAIDADGTLHPLRKRPNAFVFAQWTRAFPPSAQSQSEVHDARSPSIGQAAATPPETVSSTPVAKASKTVEGAEPQSSVTQPIALPHDAKREISDAAGNGLARGTSPGVFACETSPLPDDVRLRRDASSVPVAAESGAASQNNGSASSVSSTVNSVLRRPPPPRLICRARTRTGLRIIWTDDYRLVDDVCDEADVVIVARAIRSRTCNGGTPLITLRTLRRTGSIAISRTADGKVAIETSISSRPTPWTVHRTAPWPETWRRPVDVSSDAGPRTPPPENTSTNRPITPRSVDPVPAAR